MPRTAHPAASAIRRPLLRSTLLALVALGASAVATLGVQAQQRAQPIVEGQKYLMATHSFNVFIGPRRDSPGPLAALAAEAGKDGHENVGVQMIGGSTPMQHWNQGNGDDTKNIAKVGLRAGGVDVFTMSPNMTMPEEGIDLFGDLMIETNPQGRILVQHSWSAWDGKGTTPSVGGTGADGFVNADRDEADLATIQGWIESAHAPGGYLERLRTQLAGINARAGRPMAYVVPSGTAVYRLRQAVLRGEVPGVERQSQLFLDPIGHPTQPVANLVSYVWFGAMYRHTPVGLTALVDPADPTSAARERLLQEIAWRTVLEEPMSGLTPLSTQ